VQVRAARLAKQQRLGTAMTKPSEPNPHPAPLPAPTEPSAPAQLEYPTIGTQKTFERGASQKNFNRRVKDTTSGQDRTAES
jgi:hypothetical protein